jgi:aconitase A
VAKERIEFDKAMIGSCTNGSYDDLLSAALVLMAARQKGLTKARKEFVVFPGSGGVKTAIERPDPRLQGESIADVFRGVGGEIRASWCGPCFGQGPDSLAKGQRAITVVQPQLAEPHGPRRRGLPRLAGRGRCVRAGRLYGAANGTRADLGSEKYGV